MAKYVYPAIFTEEEEGGYSIDFPDFGSCFTCAEDLESGMEKANDVLCLTLYGMEEDGETIPAASSIEAMQQAAKPGEFATLVACDTLKYRKFFEKRAVKKTLSIPAWLNVMAERAALIRSFKESPPNLITLL